MATGSEWIREDLAALCRVLDNPRGDLEAMFAKAEEALYQALKAGNKVLAFGNGGSAADAEHLVGELTGRFGYDRPPLPAIALTGPTAGVTAIGNDYGYDVVFERQLLGLGKPGDVAIGITTSGNSPNVLKALDAAKKNGMVTIALTGAFDSKASAGGHFCLRAPSRQTPRIQEIHAVLIHSLCRAVELRLFPKHDRDELPAEKIIDAGRIMQFARVLKPWNSVFTNGCFDILHPGHVDLLQKSRSLGDLLIVGVNTDESVKRLKGPQRPFHSLKDRMKILAALACVDFVVAFGEDTPLELIRKLTPKILVKGGDYHRDTVVGADWVENNGGRVEIIPLVPGHSTTNILKTQG